MAPSKAKKKYIWLGFVLLITQTACHLQQESTLNVHPDPFSTNQNDLDISEVNNYPQTHTRVACNMQSPPTQIWIWRSQSCRYPCALK